MKYKMCFMKVVTKIILVQRIYKRLYVNTTKMEMGSWVITNFSIIYLNNQHQKEVQERWTFQNNLKCTQKDV